MSEIRPYICSRDARAAIDWYVDAMGATITYEPIVMDDGRIGHVELSFGGATVMMSDPTRRSTSKHRPRAAAPP